MKLEYVILKYDEENGQVNNKIASQMNVVTDNVTSQCFYVKMRQMFGLFIHIYSYSFLKYVDKIRGIQGPVE